jgi:hypothetical protein
MNTDKHRFIKDEKDFSYLVFICVYLCLSVVNNF